MNDFAAILYENSKIPFFDLKFLVSGPTFYELVTSKSFFLRLNWIGEHEISKPKIYIYICFESTIKDTKTMSKRHE